MRPPYTTLFDPDSTEDQVQEARQQVLEEIAEAEHERDNLEYFYDVWQNIHEATETASEQGDDELHDYLENNWQIMKQIAEKQLQP